MPARIRYAVPKTGHISLKVYNLLGEEVAILFEGVRQAGSHVVSFGASGPASGIYLYHLRTENYIETKRLAVVR